MKTILLACLLACGLHAQTLGGASRTHLSTLNNRNALPQVGLLAAWDFSDLQNQTVARDISGNGYDMHMVVNGSATAITPWSRSANGVDLVNFGGFQNTALPALTGAFSVVVALKTADNYTSYSNIIASLDPSTNTGWELAFNSPNAGALTYQNNPGNWCQSSTVINDGLWHVGILTVNASGVANIYVDGLLVKNCPSAGLPPGNTFPTQIGGLENATGNHFSGSFAGTVAFAAIYTSALTSQQAGDISRYVPALATKPNVPLPSTYPTALVTVPTVASSSLPPMGWNSWYGYQQFITEAQVKANATAMTTNGMLAAGYNYVSADASQLVRLPNTQIAMQPTQFPDGGAALGTYIHGLGFKYGMYTSPGPGTCDGGAGSTFYETQDAATFASWQIDLLKYDLCQTASTYAGWTGYTNSASYAGVDQYAYQTMGQALNATGRPVLFWTCQYGDQGMTSWIKQTGASIWRTTFDVVSWALLQSQSFIASNDAGNRGLIGGGYWNDLDLLQVGNTSTGLSATPFTDDQGKTQMSLWSMMSSPLIESALLPTISSNSLATLLNTDIIAIDQDALGLPGYRVSQSACGGSGCEVWAKKITGTNTCAIAFFNRDDGAAHTITTTWAAVAAVVPACGSGPYTTTSNLWSTWPTCTGGAGHSCAASLGTLTSGYTTASIPADGVVVLKVAP